MKQYELLSHPVWTKTQTATHQDWSLIKAKQKKNLTYSNVPIAKSGYQLRWQPAQVSVDGTTTYGNTITD